MAPDPISSPILEFSKISKAFAKTSGDELLVLDSLDLTLREGEILGLLGRSGSGKSTLLRIAAGLVKPSSGQAFYCGAALTGPTEGIAVVFQSFALYPWLTVLENVELGLDAAALPMDEVRSRALAAIDLIGLDGFQSAFPRELSGGMRQRVGFARALVSDPCLLLMDEPFSALDVLTAETLRTDLIDLWTGHQLPTKAVLMVTHNIEEAILLCDRVLVLGSNPGHIAAEIPVKLPQPRDRQDPAFRDVVDQVYAILTARMTASTGAQSHGGRAQRLPSVSISQLSGFVDVLASPAYGGRAELTRLARSLALKSEELFPIAAALHILEFAELDGGTIKLTAAGRVFADSQTEERKRLFREHLLHFVPLAAHIRQVLEERETHNAPRERFAFELQDHLVPGDAEATLRAAIDWGRFGELSDTMNVGRLTKWLKQPGAALRKGDAIAEIETDKAVMEVEAFHDGYLAGPLAPVDTDLPLGAPIAYIVDDPSEIADASAEAPTAAKASAPSPAAASPVPATAPVEAIAAPVAPAFPPATPIGPAGATRASPYARRLAAQLGVDLATVGTGTVRAADVLGAANTSAAAAPVADPADGPPRRIERNSSLREAVAQTMIASAGTPTFRVTAELPLAALVTVAKARGLSVNLLLARAAAFTIQEHPLFNAMYTPEGIAWRDRVDIAIAVDSPDGLITPVLRDVAGRPFAVLSDDWHALLEKAATRRIKPAEHRGATFYISDLGVFPVVHSFESIIPTGAAALLSVAALCGGTALGTLNCDHRVVFGGDAARFLQTFVARLVELDRLTA